MPIPPVAQKWSASVNTVTIGATKAEGGTRGRTVTVGGQTGLPFLDFEGRGPHRPGVAVEVLDSPPAEWSRPLAEAYGDVWNDPAKWARRAVEFGADLINLRLVGCHPEAGDWSPEQAVETVRAVLGAVDLPLVIWGCDHPAKDQKILPKVAEAARGENCLLGAVTEKEYRTLTAAAQAYGHKLIALSPLDINKAKQVNVLVSDMGYPVSNVVIYPTTASLGYGMEYVYSILERIRLAALAGDRLMAQPVILDVGYEAWRAKEARAGDEAAAAWGPPERRGPLWEAATASVLLQAGADLFIMRHPEAIKAFKETAGRLVAS